MKSKQLAENRGKKISELNKQIEKLQTELLELKLQTSVGKLKDVHGLKFRRRDIAQLKTIKREKEWSETA